ncbi:MAG: OmpA family protein [Flavobacterium sp.]|nr:OmpA family protein [Flavobacterium sp.]
MTNLQDSFNMGSCKRLLVVLCVLVFQFAGAQDLDLKKANRYFDRTYYSEALPMYEALVNDNRSMEVVRNLADCYYYTNDLENAQKWYRTLIKGFNVDEEYYFRYIQTLKAAGNYTEANKTAHDFLQKSNNTQAIEKLDFEIENLENVSAIGNRFDIKSLSINTKNSEFGAIKYGQSLIYSGIQSAGLFEKIYKWNNENYLDLIAIPLEKIITGDAIATSFSIDINTNMHEANAVFSKDGKTMYFTRNNFKKGKRAKDKNKVSNLQIFKAEFDGTKWINIVSLPFNSDDYSTEHPALSYDEKTLYFASDMPGSLGSFDIYSVAINGGSFDKPVNLGNTINTPRKEQFPFVSKDNKLYFSSNGHFGYGSLDVFVSDIKNDTYATPLNVGLPVNSGYDDFTFNIDSDTKDGYFASNRPEGKGGDDIYQLHETKPLIIEGCKQFITGVITDIDTKQPLENAQVILQAEDKTTIATATTMADGKFSFTVACLKSYTVLASKEAYSKDSRALKLKKERNKINDASMALKSDAAVKAAAEIAAQKQKAAAEAAAKKEKELAVAIKKEKVEKIIAAEKDIVKDKDRLLIKTEPIYFDYDLWYIRKESKPILNKVIALMKKYPDMVVEIGSHTDVRGNNQYNLDLSAKRAASTLDYFLEQGIPNSRISAKGYGETVPIIRCVPDHSCSEEQHELNRRSEFVIKSL